MKDQPLFAYLSHSSILIETVDLPFGVLDLHFDGSGKRLGIVTSAGSFILYELLDLANYQYQDQAEFEQCYDELDRRQLGINEVQHHQIFDPSTVMTSFAWDPRHDNCICVTTATGSVAIVDISGLSDNTSTEAVTICSHSLEAWITCFAPQGFVSDGIFSGGDDAILQWSSSSSWPVQHNLSCCEGNTVPSLGIHWHNSNIHSAGVTALLPLALGPNRIENVLLTGSYDDHLRVLALPPASGSRPQLLAELNLGGGVWFLKPIEVSHGHDTRDDTIGSNYIYCIRLLACCMYAGARVVEVRKVSQGRHTSLEKQQPQNKQCGSTWWEIEQIALFEGHESMCYAGDNFRQQRTFASERGTDLAQQFVTCSFYDKKLCVWKI